MKPLELLHKAFDLGIIHFDLANNYGPSYGPAEANFGRILQDDLAVYRANELSQPKLVSIYGLDLMVIGGLANIWSRVWIKVFNEWGLIMSIFSITIDLTLKPLWKRACQP